MGNEQTNPEPSKHVIETRELHELIHRYKQWRVQQGNRVTGMMGSLQKHRQICPVIAVMDEDELVLVDGYLRVEGLRRSGHDTVQVEIRSCGIAEALLRLLAQKNGRSWEAIEEAHVYWKLGRCPRANCGFGLSITRTHPLKCERSW